MRRFQTSGDLRWKAKQLRQNMTLAESALWKRLRAHRLRGHSFRRQVPMGPYIADFVCHRARLIVEVDGGQHAGSTTDAIRDRWFADQGYRVLRFWNNDVLGNMQGVLGAILESANSPLPNPPPSRGRGLIRACGSGTGKRAVSCERTS